MDQVKEWGVSEFKRLSAGGFLEQDQIKILFNNLCSMEPVKISSELSNLLDFSVKENKAFITDFTERV